MSFLQKSLALTLGFLCAALVASPVLASGACLAITQNLSLGSADATSNGQVSKLQTFFGIPPTGYFGPITKKAVQKWQLAEGVAAPGASGYGVVGPKTRATLSLCRVGLPKDPPVLVPVTNKDPIPLSVATSSAVAPSVKTTTTNATTSPYIANIPSLFGTSTPVVSANTGGVPQTVKDQIIAVILNEQKIYASNDLAAIRALLASSTADEPALSSSYKTMTDDQASQFLPLVRSIASGIPSEAALRAPTVGWQVDDTKATLQVGGTTLTLKKIDGMWY